MFKYMVACPPLDIWHGLMTEDELLIKLCNDRGHLSVNTPDNCLTFFATIEDERVNIKDMVSCINHSLLTQWSDKEEPHTVMFFITPNMINDCDTSIHGVAKISNNGTTFVFTNDLKLAEYYADPDIFEVIELGKI